MTVSGKIVRLRLALPDSSRKMNMSVLPITLTIIFGLWLLWASLSDGVLPLLALREPKKYGAFTLMAGLFSLIPLACIVGQALMGTLNSGKVWPIAIAYFGALVILEVIVAKKKGLVKEINGKKGLSMSYRVPVGFVLVLFFFFTIPKLFNEPVWTLAATMAVALPIGLLGRLMLIKAEYVSPDELVKK